VTRNLLLLAVPLAFWAEFRHWDGVWIFLISALALLPLASWMGTATEELAARAGSTVGGLLNATFGNDAEQHHALEPVGLAVAVGGSARDAADAFAGGLHAPGLL